MAIKLLLDTDIGSDIDDAVCLAYLLAQKDCDLMGITTVTGEAVKRAMIASALCRAAGRDIPIYPGAEKPFVGNQLQPYAPQASALERWSHQTKFLQGEAVEFLRHTIRANPGEIILLTIGPLTNIGLLFAQDPEIPHLLKGLVMMCGVFTGNYTVPEGEWNARLDPEATEVVYLAQPAIHRSIGLDVTMQTVMPDGDIRERFTPRLLRPVLDFAEVWFQHSKNLVFHDPLAATTIFDDQICNFQRGTVLTECKKEPGQTRWVPDGSRRHEVAMQVNVPRFYEHFFSTIESYPEG